MIFWSWKAAAGLGLICEFSWGLMKALGGLERSRESRWWCWRSAQFQALCWPSSLAAGRVVAMSWVFLQTRPMPVGGRWSCFTWNVVIYEMNKGPGGKENLPTAFWEAGYFFNRCSDVRGVLLCSESLRRRMLARHASLLRFRYAGTAASCASWTCKR